MNYITSLIKLEDSDIEKVNKFIEHWRKTKDLPCESLKLEKKDNKALLLELRYALDIFDKSVTQFIAILFGELSFITSFGKVIFLDLKLPDEVYKWFGGPKFGAEEVGKRFGVSDYPMLVAIIKPSLGKELNTDKIRTKIESVLDGGFHAVKDDEMQGNLSYTQTKERIALAKKYKKYIPALNLDSIEDYKKYLGSQDSGKIGMVLVNATISGFPLLHEIRKITKVPILSHVALQGVYSSNFSPKLFALLHRLFGCDAFINPAGETNYFAVDKNQEKEMAMEFTKDLPIKKTIPLLTGGLRLHNLNEIIKPYELMKIPYGVVFGSLIFASEDAPMKMCKKTIQEVKRFKSKY